MVPRFLTCGSPIDAATSHRPGMVERTSAQCATWSWVVMAPMSTPVAFFWMPRSSATRERSTMTFGLASRSFMVGSSVCPPASSLASPLPARSLAASATDCGRWYWKAYMCLVSLLGGHLGRRLLGGLPDGPRRCRHGDVLVAERVGDGIDDGGGR